MSAARASLIAVDELPGQDCGMRDGCATAGVYATIEAEYECVRQRVGLQDLSHCGKFAVRGDAACDVVNHLVMTDVSALPINRLQPSFMLDDRGRPVCEMFILNLGQEYLLLTEGAPPEAVLARLTEAVASHPGGTIADRSDELALFSLDGPYAWELLKGLVGLGVIGTRYLDVVPDQSITGIDVTFCRAGKTGEYGYILFAAASQTQPLWQALKTAGAPFALLPVGYLAADLCRLENNNPNTHHEGKLVDNVLELNTRAMLGRDKADHVGRAALQAVIATGVARRLVGVKFPEALPAQQNDLAVGAAINLGDRVIGSVVNAGYSFTLRRWIGLALLDTPFAAVGVEYDVPTPCGVLAAATVSMPFLANKSLTVRPQEDSYFA